MSVEKCPKTGSVGIFPARYCAKAFKHSCQHLSVRKEIKQDTKIWTHELTDTEAASGESFVSWEEILNSSVVVVRHCHSTQRLVATFAAELTLTLTHHSVTTTTTTLRLHHASSTIPSVDAHFQSLHRSSATHCHLTSNHPRLCPPSVNILKNILFSSVFSQHSSVTLLHLHGLRNSCAILAN